MRKRAFHTNRREREKPTGGADSGPGSTDMRQSAAQKPGSELCGLQGPGAAGSSQLSHSPPSHPPYLCSPRHLGRKTGAERSCAPHFPTSGPQGHYHGCVASANPLPFPWASSVCRVTQAALTPRGPQGQDTVCA